jgi:uncharacterized phage-associated protein
VTTDTENGGGGAVNAPYDPMNVAYYFLQKADPDAGDLISPANLHLLLYYAQGFHLALNARPLFQHHLVAGANGPRVSGLAELASPHTALSVPPTFDAAEIFTADTMDLLDEVYVTYGQFTTWKLRQLAQGEPPWRTTPTDQVMTPDVLRAYFQTQVAD